jgi:formylglycine-generating enzyme required for sulfatase activity
LARLFISHSSANNAAAIALCSWLSEQGFDDVFLDVDPDRGLVAGQRWQEALKAAADRCEAVLFLISTAWLASKWCLAEFLLAKTLHKRIFGLVIEPVPLERVPVEMAEWQMCQLIGADPLRTFDVPINGKQESIAFREAGLDLLRRGLERAGLDAKSFPWPPPGDPKRAPYRGLRALEAEDSAIFFGREAAIVRGLDRIRGLVDDGLERLLVVLGASGSGKSSFLRAGLWPRLARDDLSFLPLPIIRPQTAVITGSAGLVAALAAAFERLGETRPPGRIKEALLAGSMGFDKLLNDLSDLAKRRLVGFEEEKHPAIILAVDQAEELFSPDGIVEAESFLQMLGEILALDSPARHILVLVTIRSDRYELLQAEQKLSAVKQDLFNLPPIPPAEFKTVIEGPALRVAEAGGRLTIDPALTEQLIADAKGADALPLLAFTLERLYADYGSEGRLTLDEYGKLGGVKGSIEEAISQALSEPNQSPQIPAAKEEQFACLRAAFIPWLARIDPENGMPIRRTARSVEIPHSSLTLVQRLVDARLLLVDRRGDTDVVEVAHEALLRQWGQLQGWLTEDAGQLAVLEGVKRASRDWTENNRGRAWLAHTTDRLAAAQRLNARADLAAILEPTDREYLAACRKAEADARRGKRLLLGGIYVLLVGIIAGLVGWINQDTIKEQWRWYTLTRPYMVSQVRPHVLTVAQERALKPGDTFKECATDCPEMIVIPAGSFVMGSPPTEKGRNTFEGPQHTVKIAHPLAVAKFELTFDEWDACASYGDCDPHISASHGRGQQPVANITFDDAEHYLSWFSRMTGKSYRLLSEAEYEYATRAGTQTAYPWGEDLGQNNAACEGCGSPWDDIQPAPVGSFAPNQFGLYDMVGNIFERVMDCVHSNYNGSPTDGSAWIEGGNCNGRIVRGGSWNSKAVAVRSASRSSNTPDARSSSLGFRVGRTLAEP